MQKRKKNLSNRSRSYYKVPSLLIRDHQLEFTGSRDMTEYNEWQENVTAEKKAEEENKKFENVIKGKRLLWP